MAGRRIRCALLTTFRFDWASEIVLACPGLEFLVLAPPTVGLPESPNPFGLPEDDRADVTVVSSIWFNWLVWRFPDRVDEVMRNLDRCCDLIVALDSADDFSLGVAPRLMREAAIVLKPQGLYRDRDLYNYALGPWYPGALRTEKVRPLRVPYSSGDLDKLRLSVPCFMTELLPLRRMARLREVGPAPVGHHPMQGRERLARDMAAVVFERCLSRVAASRRPRPLGAHCVVTLTHVQRIEVMRLLDGILGARGITRVPSLVAGTEHPVDRLGPPEETPLPAALLAAVATDAAPYRRAQLGRNRYLIELSRHQIVVAPMGYGELGNRHADAWRAGAALVCQDLSHVEMMFPIDDRRNAVFCRADLSNLRSTVEDLLADPQARTRIAHEGRKSFDAWASRWRDSLHNGIATHIRGALGCDGPV